MNWFENAPVLGTLPTVLSEMSKRSAFFAKILSETDLTVCPYLSCLKINTEKSR
jgi:hypothetical protein